MAQFGILSSFDHNIQSWQVYKDRLQQWFIANGIVEREDPAGIRRRAVLLSALSEATYRIVNDLALPKELQRVPFNEILELLDDHFIPKRCGFGERYKFFAAMQLEGESFSQWAARLRRLTAHCGFLNVEESIRDHFIMGMLQGAERVKLFAQDPKELTLAKAVELAESLRWARRGATLAVGAGQHSEQLSKTDSKSDASNKVRCSVCGIKNHTPTQCRFANYMCKKCHVKGHMRRMCKKNKVILNESIDENGDDGQSHNGRNTLPDLPNLEHSGYTSSISEPKVVD